MGEEQKLTFEGDFAGSGGQIWRGTGAISSRAEIVGVPRLSLRFEAKKEKGRQTDTKNEGKSRDMDALGLFHHMGRLPTTFSVAFPPSKRLNTPLVLSYSIELSFTHLQDEKKNVN